MRLAATRMRFDLCRGHCFRTSCGGGECLLTGELRGKIDRVWDAFWAGGIANPLEVIEQIT